MSLAYLSALGMMGRRHLKGLVRAGLTVVASDPNPAVFDVARAELAQAGLPVDRLLTDDTPVDAFDVAIFSETTTARLANFERCLARAKLGKVLLEKPISADPAEFGRFLELAGRYGIAERTEVNFIRRTWSHVRQLAELCAQEQSFTVTLNGGAIGLGCMGVHYLDTFLCIAGDETAKVAWVSLSTETVKSGRGQQFEDFGGSFVAETRRGRLMASLEADSSANVIMTVRGQHFMAQVDYGDLTWKVVRRKADSALPFYRYGADYEIVEQGKLELPAMDAVTEAWAKGEQTLLRLEQALPVHRLLDDILRAGGAQPPYRFT